MNTSQSVTINNSYTDYVFDPAKKISSTDNVIIFGELKITVPRVPRTVEETLITEFEESRFQGEIMELKSINHPRFELLVPITLIVEYIEDEYIVSCPPPIEIFTYGRDSNKVKEDFGILLADYYESLVKNKDSLAINLLNELKFLSGILKAKK
jgi:hypothetical protein